MQWIKAAKICVILTAFLFVAKPFLGYDMFNSKHPPASDNIFVKVFAKRTPEFLDNTFNLLSKRKFVTDPVQPQLLLFACFLTILFPSSFAVKLSNNSRSPGYFNLSRPPIADHVLLNGNFTI